MYTKSLQHLLLLMVLFSSYCTVAYDEKKAVNIYIGHQKAPYVTNLSQRQGLYFDLVRQFNSRSENYRFELVYMPRKRLNRNLHEGSLDGAVLGVIPAWFKDKSQSKYLWTEGIFEDYDLVVSSVQLSFEYQTPESMTGQTIVGVTGYYYYGVDELVHQQKIVRVDVENEHRLLEMIILGRVNIGIIGHATLLSILADNESWRERLHLSKNTFSKKFLRRILIPKYYPELLRELNPLISSVINSREWQKVLQSYY
ncbi:transporter substrate-binding domain-containing protein [Thalassomonas viridans]|uniref:Transporter substrate-binding domain-containing protein n=1 Tax=Thalassomonas viridans TaxID=137584 RepID=A0AAE9Z5P7_9GAMM|nr:transporter substrate-binding domain-containing protein [Thalassomonas viridans]WDE07083.1 transporter substrate-binding domain-containing protein [Thalassomonas viridans]